MYIVLWRELLVYIWSWTWPYKNRRRDADWQAQNWVWFNRWQSRSKETKVLVWHRDKKRRVFGYIILEGTSERKWSSFYFRAFITGTSIFQVKIYGQIRLSRSLFHLRIEKSLEYWRNQWQSLWAFFGNRLNKLFWRS